MRADPFLSSCSLIVWQIIYHPLFNSTATAPYWTETEGPVEGLGVQPKWPRVHLVTHYAMQDAGGRHTTVHFSLWRGE